MPIDDLRDRPPGSRVVAEVCIVGSGPAGATIAMELAATGVAICLVESGGAEPDPAVDDLSEIESVGMHRAPQAVTRARVLGGTSSLWTGRCGALDAVDFAERPWVPHSGWPVTDDDLAPYLDRAGALLGLGPARHRGHRIDRVDPPSPSTGTWDRSLLLPVLFQFSVGDPATANAVREAPATGVEAAEHIGALQHVGAPAPVDFGTDHLPALADRPNVTVLTHATVVEVETTDDGRAVTGVEVRTLDGRRSSVVAPRVVLACGGIDNARLLLASRRTNPAGVGNDRDVVGRYLMDHPYAPVAAYEGDGDRALRRRIGLRWVDIDDVRHVYSLGVRLSPERQWAEQLLNAEIIAVDEGDSRSPLRRAADAVRRVRSDGPSRPALAELAAAGSRPDRLAWSLYERRVLRRPSLSAAGRVGFGCVVEQVPDPLSRVTLSDSLDGLGQPRARVDWRASDAEFATLERMLALFVDEARRLGHTPPVVQPWLAGGVDAWRASVHDMAHPIGTTRMASDPARGVVDADCQVHGVAGLSVAGSSTFATSGYMNPTLTIVALALRLADHLAAGLAAERPAVIATDPRPSSARLRVGLIGFGDRIRRFHLPVLQALPEQFEVVGFTARSEATRRTAAEETGLVAYDTADDLVVAATPDLVVAAVSPDAVDASLPGILGLGVPVLLETPLCWNLATGRSAVAQIESSGLLVGVAEQTPHLPLEQLKRRVIELGLIGQVEAAHNDGAVFDYHGLAALRAYLDGGRRPALVRAMELAGERGPVLDATITCTDGTTLLHRYEDGVEGSLVASTSRGGFRDDVVVIAEGRQQREVRVERIETDGGDLRSLVARLPQAEAWWHNPFAGRGFSDEQVAVASVLVDFAGAVRTGGEPAYLAEDSLLDMEVLTAMRYSAAEGGRTVSLPVSAADRLRSKLAPRLKRR